MLKSSYAGCLGASPLMLGAVYSWSMRRSLKSRKNH